MHKLTLHLLANSLHLTDDLEHGKAGTAVAQSREHDMACT